MEIRRERGGIYSTVPPLDPAIEVSHPPQQVSTHPGQCQRVMAALQMSGCTRHTCLKQRVKHSHEGRATVGKA